MNFFDLSFLSMLISAIACLASVVSYVSISLKKQRTAELRMKLMARDLHNIFERISYELYDLLTLGTIDSNNNKISPYYDNHMRIQLHCQSVVEILAQLLSQCTGVKVIVSIKIVGLKDEKGTDLTNNSLNNIARQFVNSNNADPRRDEHESALIGHNSMFTEIIESGSNYFASRDLMKKYGYLNTTHRWHKFYRSVIVVPIRLRNPRKEGLYGSMGSYELLGFIIADSLEVNAFKPWEKVYADILGAVANGLANLIAMIPKDKSLHNNHI